MKFLCVECDEAMSLEEARGPDDGAMTVVFRCPSCERETAMLTNPMETQVVSSLGVSIGEDEETSSEPMEMVRSSLAEQEDGAAGEASADEERSEEASESGSKCPFTDVVQSAEAEQDGESEEREASSDEPRWTEGAEERLSNIPSFARSMARKSIEQHAEEQGYAEIDTDVMDEVKGQFGMF